MHLPNSNNNLGQQVNQLGLVNEVKELKQVPTIKLTYNINISRGIKGPDQRWRIISLEVLQTGPLIEDVRKQ